MKLKVYIIISVVLCVFLTGCPIDIQYSIRINNNSTQTIYVCAQYILPDTLLPINKPLLKEIKSGKIGTIYGYDINDNTFDRLKNERLTIFVLDKKQVDENSWEYLRKHNLVLKRYEGNASELSNYDGWRIYYP